MSKRIQNSLAEYLHEKSPKIRRCLQRPLTLRCFIVLVPPFLFNEISYLRKLRNNMKKIEVSSNIRLLNVEYAI